MKIHRSHIRVIFLAHNKDIEIHEEGRLMMLLPIIAIGALVYFFFYDNGSNKVTFQKNQSAEALLKERYVKGEIDEKTYLQMKETIK